MNDFPFLCIMLYLKKEINKTQFAIWKIEESKDELLSMLHHKDYLQNILSIKSDKILLEKLAVRVLIKELLGEEKQIYYHQSGKPYLGDNSCFISISHTQGYAAVAINNSHHIGIDIEQISEKIKRVRKRVVSENEYINSEKELEHLLLHWSSKESIFKILDVDGVDYIEHIHVHPFSPQSEGYFKVSESRSKQGKTFELYYQVTNDYVLTLIVK